MYINIVNKGKNTLGFSDVDGNTLDVNYVLGILSDGSHVIYKRTILQHAIDGISETPFQMVNAQHYMIITSDEYQDVLFKENVKKIKEKIQRNWFRIVNFINRIKSLVWNSSVMNWTKEFLSIGMNYPVFLYCDETGEYVSSFSDNKTDDGYPCFDLTDNVSYATDFKKNWKLQRFFLLKKINKLFDGQKIFRYKRIVTWF